MKLWRIKKLASQCDSFAKNTTTSSVIIKPSSLKKRHFCKKSAEISVAKTLFS